MYHREGWCYCFSDIVRILLSEKDEGVANEAIEY